MFGGTPPIFAINVANVAVTHGSAVRTGTVCAKKDETVVLFLMTLPAAPVPPGLLELARHLPTVTARKKEKGNMWTKERGD